MASENNELRDRVTELEAHIENISDGTNRIESVVNKIQDQIQDGAISFTEIKKDIEGLQNYEKKHTEFHNTKVNTASKRNWQLWIMVITNITIILVFLLKDKL